MIPAGTPAPDTGLPIAVMGTGRWGTILARAILKHRDLRLSAIVSRNVSSDSNTQSDFADIPSFKTWQDAHKASPLSGICLAVPPASQVAVAQPIIEAGIPVFFEKPLTMTTDKAHDVIETAEKNKFIGMVDHIHLFHPTIDTLRKLVSEKTIPGRIVTSSGAWGPIGRSWSALWDWGPHDVALCVAIANSTPSRVSATVLEQHDIDGSLLENIRIDIEFQNGWTARIETGSAFKDKHRRLSIEQDGDVFGFEDVPRIGASAWQQDGAERIEIPAAPTSPLERAFDEFVHRIRTMNHDHSMADLSFSGEVVYVLAEVERLLRESED